MMERYASWGLATVEAIQLPSTPAVVTADYRASSRGCAGIFVGNSPAILKVCRAIERVAPANVSVVLTGESGDRQGGHGACAARRQRPEPAALRCDQLCRDPGDACSNPSCSATSAGAFTGAVKQTVGKIEHAHRGTLFLDEIGDLPLSLQAKLLRFLQERVVERLGGRKEIEVDVRVVCATHRDLRKLMQEGSFREDLYYRLAEISVHIPPLRERVGDAVLMARHFLAQYSGTREPPDQGLQRRGAARARCLSWPGNVRELQNRVKRAVIMADGQQIGPEDLDLTVRTRPAARARPATVPRAWSSARCCTVRWRERTAIYPWRHG